jgi:hypothetical protein
MIYSRYFLALWLTGTILASPVQTFADDDDSGDLELSRRAFEANAAP